VGSGSLPTWALVNGLRVKLSRWHMSKSPLLERSRFLGMSQLGAKKKVNSSGPRVHLTEYEALEIGYG
jgi:hypothetical protein